MSEGISDSGVDSSLQLAQLKDVRIRVGWERFLNAYTSVQTLYIYVEIVQAVRALSFSSDVIH